MLVKAATDKSGDLAALDALLAEASARPQVRARIEQEIRNIRAGVRGEREAAYEMDFHFGASRNWAIVHDLRLEHQGRVAQIDHVLINRFLDLWVCESKHFSEGVSINEHGEFTAFHRGGPYGVASPLEQNRKHIAVLRDVLGSGTLQRPTRLGMALRPAFGSLVLVSKGARISRPKAEVAGLESVIKNDQLKATLERRVDDESAVTTLLSAAKIVGSETLQTFARQLAELHRPIEFDWRAKFGLAGAHGRAGQTQAPSPRVEAPAVPVPSAAAAEIAPGAEPVVREGVEPAKLSTSKLASKLGVRNAPEMLSRLVEAGYLALQGPGHALTEKGSTTGGVWIEKSRIGAYFLWPSDLKV